MKSVPQICIYYCGNNFTCEAHEESKRSYFTLPVDKACTTFSIIIIHLKDLQWVSKKNTVHYNTVNYYKAKANSSYKFYDLELVKAPFKRYRTPSETLKNKQEKKGHWNIEEKKLSAEGKIPDDTIIVLYNAEYVDNLEGNNSFELPTIIIKNDILTLAGSEKKLHDDAIELLLESIDHNPLHSHVQIHTRQDKQKIIIAMTDV
ncbi:hypothetical protein KAH94_05275 [bacterium]|nr:hypothetical protein [bacterium]